MRSEGEGEGEGEGRSDRVLRECHSLSCRIARGLACAIGRNNRREKGEHHLGCCADERARRPLADVKLSCVSMEERWTKIWTRGMTASNGPYRGLAVEQRPRLAALMMDSDTVMLW